MAEPDEIVARVEALLRRSGSLAGKHVLVTAGGTREPIDSVRFVGNRSSGRMGVALADEARRRGARVTLLAANLAVPAPAGVEVVATPTAADLEREALGARGRRRDRDGRRGRRLPRPRAGRRQAAEGRRRRGRSSWRRRPTSRARSAQRRSAGQVLVAFGAEHGAEGLERKRRDAHRQERRSRRLQRRGAQPTSASTAPDNEVTLITAGGDRLVERAPKPVIAAAILDEIERLIEER